MQCHYVALYKSMSDGLYSEVKQVNSVLSDIVRYCHKFTCLQVYNFKLKERPTFVWACEIDMMTCSLVVSEMLNTL